ncbi:initiation factor, subunit 2 family protein [Acanthamoeba castellanii str. Neff]|uniref:Translation initiation factor eIF2B subunit delta n=1 Tax=Acanthamoeba castellanii (strain ATCC 30010 / Neff) TaxID=1257118 RepID=L8HHD7_ACACF|nr:initiation factor, subunit 2 family protein [Acanthamoeba castellanii str. Neff]ELR25004.1 initiation factor, subunit 2 family protein [Acanthamoeba castellanii str. Neff]
MIDEEEEKKKRGRTPVGSLTPQTVKAQPQVRVVGFHVGGTTAPATASPAATPPVAIPSLVEGSSGSGRRIKKSVDGSPSPTSSLGHSLEGLKEYKSQLDGWSASGGGALERRTPPSSSPSAEDRKQTTLVGPKPTTSSSFEAKPSMSPTRHSSYQPLASPSASSKPMTPPLQHPSSVLVGSGPTATKASAKAPASLAKAPSGKAPSQDSDSGHDHDHGGSDDDDARTSGHHETAKKPLTRAERRAIQTLSAAPVSMGPYRKLSGRPNKPASARRNQASLPLRRRKAAVKALQLEQPPAPLLMPLPSLVRPSAGGRKPAIAPGGSAAGSKIKQYDDPKQKAQATKQSVVALEESKKQVALFSHLPQFERHTTLSMKIGFSPSEKIHPAIVNLGLKYASGTVAGSNSRCVAMLTAFKKVIRDFQTPPGTALHRTLEPHLKPQIQFLTDCRPHSISMGNAINYIKREIPKTQSMSDEEAKEFLMRRIETFIEERIVLADLAIATYGVSKINDGDVVLTYAASHPVECVLKQAHAEGKKFRVILVESTPKREAKNLMQKLVKEGIHCTLVLLNAVSYAMKEVTKVFLGAYTLLVNGHLMSRAGTAMVAMVANAYNVPVIVCCETYKFCERVQIDSICFNELGDPDELIATAEGNTGRTEALKDWRNNEHLKLLNLVYDVTPSTFITMVVTEVGMIPPTSVPVILREYPLQSMEQMQG